MNKSEWTIESTRRRNGVAGEFAIDVKVAYADEPAELVSFVGSVYGGTPVMVTPGNPRGVFVSESVSARCGSFADKPHRWVRRFFGVES